MACSILLAPLALNPFNMIKRTNGVTNNPTSGEVREMTHLMLMSD